ncbi:ADP-ribose polymerase [Rhodocytophaga rosea]|uniref:NAD(+) ADP-ribosyltransferase n=1 Tax=Rhodocytophaga rosea TaxID=2704465 RepID=A0A6C0GN25_9BACT|nr:ADP-ribose polymerase [Rhodocytophaga rosea]QHT69451.1 ADP-ribose polymerase [Rhodocytophaga rosea]
MSTNLRTVKLIMVTSDNNNKFYEMKENADGTFKVSYGRVGGTPAYQTYPVREWEKKYREKVNKGYKDQTHLFVDSDDEIELADVDNPAVQEFINMLMQYAKKSVSANYNVTAEQVTKKQVEEAQRLLDNVVAKIKVGMDLKDFNDGLLRLFAVIPRKMGNVKDHLIQSAATKEEINAIEKVLADEQATLDVMRGQVDINARKKEATEGKKEKINILQTMGLEVEPVTEKEIIEMIKDKMQEEAGKFYRAFKVKNHKSQKAYEEWFTAKPNKKEELFWHGSRNENWISIMETGLVLRPANAVITGKMFGYGLYFADKFRKSLNYSSLSGSYWTRGSADRGFLALYKVHVGKQLHIQKHEPAWCYELTEENLKKKGKDLDSLFAEGGADLRNNEYIVYNQAQCAIQYLIEVRN